MGDVSTASVDDHGDYETAMKLIDSPGHTLLSYGESCLVDNMACKHAAHAMVFARQEGNIFDKNCFPLKAAVMMQVRFDGYLGFPGGIVDPGEDIVQAVNREMQEELGLESGKYECTMDDYISTHQDKNNLWVLHFFTKEVSIEDFRQIERNSLLAADYGTEVQGNIRVPLYTLDNRGRGLPMFLRNNFVGNSKQQLLQALLKTGVLSPREVTDAVRLAGNE